MELKVLGCHGGETARHRSTSFLVDDRLALDAGATTAMLTLEEQMHLDAVVVSHAHLDHVRDLASLADNRCQGAARPLVVAGTAATIRALREHFFNNVLWPDFTNIPLVGGGGATVELRVLEPEVPQEIAGYALQAVLVSHTVESAGIVVSRDGAALAFSGDTGPHYTGLEGPGRTPDVADCPARGTDAHPRRLHQRGPRYCAPAHRDRWLSLS